MLNPREVQTTGKALLDQVQECQFLSWKHSPVGKLLIRYMEDFHLALKEAAWEALLAEGVDNKYLSELVGRARTVQEIADLPFSAIVNFYSNEEENAAKAI